MGRIDRGGHRETEIDTVMEGEGETGREGLGKQMLEES